MLKIAGGSKYCCVDGCYSKHGSGYSFFRFPKNEDRCEKWKEALGFSNNHKYANFTVEHCHSTIRICSLHFNEDSFRSNKTSSRKLLNVDAIPIKFNQSVCEPDRNILCNPQCDPTCEDVVNQLSNEVASKKDASSETPLNLPKETSQLKNQPAELRRKSLRNHIIRDLSTSDIFEFLDENYKQEDTMTIKNQLLLLELSSKGNRATVTSQQTSKKMRPSGGITQGQESNESIEDDMRDANEFSQLQQKHDLSVLFQSLEARVSQFSPELQLEAKTQLMNIVDQLEVTNMQSARITTSSNNFVPKNQFSENQFVSNCSKPSSSHETHVYTSLNLNTPMDEEFYPEEKVSIDKIDEFVSEEQEQIYNDEVDEFAPEQKVNVQELALNEHILASKPKEKTNIDASEFPPEQKINIEEYRVLDPEKGKVVKTEFDTDIHGIEFEENVNIKTEFDLYENVTVKKEFIVEENVKPDESDQMKNVNIDQFTQNENSFADKFPDRKV